MRVLQKLVLALIGLAVVFLGADIGLGGIATLGWQIDPSFVAATLPDVFATQDSHTRFLGGVWCAVGLVFLLGAWRTELLRQSIISLCLIIALAGLFRLSGSWAVVLSNDVIGSFLLELIGFPLLALWLAKSATSKST